MLIFSGQNFCSTQYFYFALNKRALSIRYTIFCEWFGIDNCFISQIWFFGTFGLSTFMWVATYLIAGFLYGF
ncbi:hypothetical protein CN980_30125 [Bacillus cereus]|uniref:Uncharacterized protein n=1 Tax=Bacillus cereus TaxID=1396 RepID=A0A9X7C5L6_BACCE|nr:hypothetical protein CN980_30125 [Bacillus cereus]